MTDRKALISVYNKVGIEDFASSLHDMGWTLYASGGTAEALIAAGLPVIDVADLTGSDAILDHRVVTLHPAIYAGLLAEDTAEGRAELRRLRYPFFDLVCVDFYPLSEIARDPAATLEQVVKLTDIGGPTMARAAAKGGRIIITDAADRAGVLAWLRGGERDADLYRRELAAKAEFTVAVYAAISAKYLGENTYYAMLGQLFRTLRYGENPHQQWARHYITDDSDPLALHQFVVVAGPGPGYVNTTDMDRLLTTITTLAAGFSANFNQVPHIALGVKHGNACGAGVSNDPLEAIHKMVLGDPQALYGGAVMVNFPIGLAEAEVLLTHGLPRGRRFLNVIAAPSFTREAVEYLSRGRENCQILENPALADLNGDSRASVPQMRQVRGGLLVQDAPQYVLKVNDPELVNGSSLSTAGDIIDAVLAWGVGSTSGSNTITIVRKGQLLANAVGQQDRVGAARLAVTRASQADHNLAAGALGYSDSFFPFSDGALVLADAGVHIILATSGSKRDEEVAQALRDRGVLFITIPDSRARGFYGH
jgi:phosphoribosylaminoimidazolecarboxamide formyltransferase / IMP cyclohydrolase